MELKKLIATTAIEFENSQITFAELKRVGKYIKDVSSLTEKGMKESISYDECVCFSKAGFN